MSQKCNIGIHKLDRKEYMSPFKQRVFFKKKQLNKNVVFRNAYADVNISFLFFIVLWQKKT